MPKWEMSTLRPSWIEVEIDGVVYSGREVKDIHMAFRDRRIADGGRIEPGDEDRVWQAIKDAYPKFIIKGKKPSKPGMSVGAAWSFIRYLEKRMKNKALVEPSEAQRRADICLVCPQRMEVSGCGVCKQALGLFVKPGQKLQPEPPQGCRACGCWLPAKVWIPREVLGPADEWPFAEPDDAAGFPGCWML